MNFSHFSNNKSEKSQDFEKQMNNTPQTLKDPSFGGGLVEKKSVSRDMTPTSKQKQTMVLDKSPQNVMSIQV